MLIRLLYALALVAIPFSAAGGLDFLGEMTRELSTYVFLPLFGVVIIKLTGSEGFKKLTGSGTLTKILTVIFGCFVLSFIVNAYPIFNSEFRGRSGLGKFLSSMMVVIYGFGIAYLTYFVTNERWKDVIIKPIAISAVICLCYSFFEILSRKFNVMNGFFTVLEHIAHYGGADIKGPENHTIIAMAEGWDPRLRSLAFEPPAFGAYAGFAWPWIYIGYITSQARAKFNYGLILGLFTLLIIVAEARTGWLMLAANIGIIFLLKYIYMPKQLASSYRGVATATTCGLIGIFAFGMFLYLMHYDRIVGESISTHYISNISRMASIEAAFNMMKDAPVFGFGFGQYGFYSSQYIPYWGYYSYELQPALAYPNRLWPASYSIYARFAAELGMTGILMWIGVWLWTLMHTIKATLRLQAKTGEQPIIAYGIVMCCAGALISGVATDTLRTPMLWVTLGLAGRYFYECRKTTVQLAASTPRTAQTTQGDDIVSTLHAAPG